MKEVTLGKIVNLENIDTMHIPGSWIKNFNEEQHKYAIFLKNNASMFRFIPTRTNNVLEFHMRLTELEENFLQRLFQVFEGMNTDFAIKPIYSSGVCFVDEDCYYFFLVEHINQEVEEKLKFLLKQLKGVEEVVVKKYVL